MGGEEGGGVRVVQAIRPLPLPPYGGREEGGREGGKGGVRGEG